MAAPALCTAGVNNLQKTSATLPPSLHFIDLFVPQIELLALSPDYLFVVLFVLLLFSEPFWLQVFLNK